MPIFTDVLNNDVMVFGLKLSVKYTDHDAKGNLKRNTNEGKAAKSRSLYRVLNQYEKHNAEANRTNHSNNRANDVRNQIRCFAL